VNVSSICGLVGTARNAVYSTAKAGIIELTKCVAIEYGTFGIRCNCVCPGTVDTDMTRAFLAQQQRYERLVSAIPLRRISQPAEIAEAILYLGADESAYMTGAVLTIDGGMTVY
jgi:NAD(P)-dependent dehydrogenase (short-subunit alcohol dehydrogenase family)